MCIFLGNIQSTDSENKKEAVTMSNTLSMTTAAEDNQKEAGSMNETYNYITEVISKLEAKLNAGESRWTALPVETLQSGPLAFDTIEIDEDAAPECYEHWLPAFDYSIKDILELGFPNTVELFHWDERRPDTLVCNTGEDNEPSGIFYRSPFHTGDCEVAGTAFVLALDNDNDLFLTRMLYKGKLYYELFLTAKKVVDLIEEHDEAWDPYRVLHQVSYIANSCDEAMYSRLEHLYKSIDVATQLPFIDSELRSKLNSLL